MNGCGEGLAEALDGMRGVATGSAGGESSRGEGQIATRCAASF